jgi:hypothetical protein
MTSIDRTAYPRPGSRLTREELRVRYTLTEMDLTFIEVHVRIYNRIIMRVTPEHLAILDALLVRPARWKWRASCSSLGSPA